jgi:DNA-directed RNA polymerase specialized sigma subunit
VEYNYSFTSSGIINVEVDPQWIDIMEGLDRAEHANDEYNRRLYIKLSCGNQHEPDPCEIVCRAESMIELMKKLENLTDRQREVLTIEMETQNRCETARLLGVSEGAIRKVLRQIQKKVFMDGTNTP